MAKTKQALPNNVLCTVTTCEHLAGREIQLHYVSIVLIKGGFNLTRQYPGAGGEAPVAPFQCVVCKLDCQPFGQKGPLPREFGRCPQPSTPQH